MLRGDPSLVRDLKTVQEAVCFDRVRNDYDIHIELEDRIRVEVEDNE